MRVHRAVTALAVLALSLSRVVADEPHVPELSLGAMLAGAAVPDALTASDPAHPIDVRVVEDWSSIEASPGSFDWSSVDGVIDTLAARGARVTLCIRSENPLYPRDAGGIPDGTWLQAWTALLRSAVKTFGTRIDTMIAP